MPLRETRPVACERLTVQRYIRIDQEIGEGRYMLRVYERRGKEILNHPIAECDLTTNSLELLAFEINALLKSTQHTE